MSLIPKYFDRKHILLFVIIFSLLFTKKSFATNRDTTINCLIFLNDQVLYPRDCQYFNFFSQSDSDKIEIKLNYNIGIIKLKIVDYDLLESNQDARLKFDFFYRDAKNCCIQKTISLQKIAPLFYGNHQYIIIRIYDMALPQNKKKYANFTKQDFIYSYETEGISTVLVEHI